MAVIQPASDSSLLVTFGTEIRPEIHAQVMALFRAFEARPLRAVTSVSPGYASVLFRFDPVLADPDQLKHQIRELTEVAETQESTPTTVELPVCYGGEFGPDLAEIAHAAELTDGDVIAIHTGETYHAYFLGFAPGFAYLGEVDARIARPRIARARTMVPAGSVGIAARQTGVYPHSTPGGWNLIGRCPLRLFDPDGDRPARIAPGDLVRFRAISHDEFRELARKEAAR